MSVKLGINGFGRISSCVVREAQKHPDVEICAINLRNADTSYMAYLLKYDTVFGRFDGTVDYDENHLIVNGKKIRVFSEDDPEKIMWSESGAEYIIDGTGAFLTSEKAAAHFKGGAKKVILTAPAKDDTPTFVMGVNHEEYKPDMDIVSNASCTTNCLAPMAKVIEINYGIENGLMSTVHASTKKQVTVDARTPKDWRAGRSVYGNIIPSTTGAAKAVGKVIPSVKGKLTGISFRIPAADASVVDFNVQTKVPTTYEDICKKMKEASETYMKGILKYTEDEIVSADVIGETNTCIFDAKMGIQLNENFFKLIAFYDNEYGYSTKCIELAEHMYKVDHAK